MCSLSRTDRCPSLDRSQRRSTTTAHQSGSLDHRTVKRGSRQTDQYLVEWKGYPISEATWEPIENLTNSIDLVSEFNQQRNVQLSAVQTILQQSFAAVARASSLACAGGADSSASRTKRNLQSRGGCNRASSLSVGISVSALR